MSRQFSSSPPHSRHFVADFTSREIFLFVALVGESRDPKPGPSAVEVCKPILWCRDNVIFSTDACVNFSLLCRQCQLSDAILDVIGSRSWRRCDESLSSRPQLSFDHFPPVLDPNGSFVHVLRQLYPIVCVFDLHTEGGLFPSCSFVRKGPWCFCAGQSRRTLVRLTFQI